MIFLLKYWKLILPFVAIIALYGAFQWAKHKGRQECKQSYEKALFEAQQLAQFQVRKIEDKYAQSKASFRARADSGYGIGPLVSDAINGLPDGPR